MAIQELDLTILHRSGKSNANADALSRCLLRDSSDENSTGEVVAAVTGTEQERNTEDSESDTLRDLQRRDQELAPIIHYLDAGILPEDSQLSRRIALTSSQYTVQDGVLY